MRTPRSVLHSGALLGLCFVALSLHCYGQPSTITPIRDDIKYLASDELAGRRAGTPENIKAANYIAERFKSLGLIPVPGGEDYFHRFSYLVGADPGKNNSLVIASRPLGAGNTSTRPLFYGEQFVPMSFSESGSVEGDLLFAGYGLTVPEMSYDDYTGIDAKGKIVIIMRYSPDGASPHGDFARFATWSRKVSNAKEHGAIGIIFINPPRDSAALLRMPFDRNYTYSGLLSVFALSTAFEDARDTRGRSLAEVQKEIDSTRKPASFPVAGMAAKLAVDLQLKREMIPNVLGMIPGNDPSLKDQIIIVGAHFDHLGNGGEGSLYSGSEPEIHHGADDNASGVAGVLALAEKFAKSHDNRRTLLFMAFNGEEEGLLGSEALVKNPPFPLEKVATMINLDMIGRLDSNSLIVQGTGTATGWDSVFFNKVNAGRFMLKLVKDGYGPSDHSSFYGKGVPVLFFFTGLHKDYHRPSDTWEKINYEGEDRIVDYIADMIRTIDRTVQRPIFTKAESSTPRSSTGFKVYVGTIPDYAFDGKGLRLSGVADGGPAEKAGLKEGDIIVRMRDKEINNIYDYTDALGLFTPKDSVVTEFMRDGKKMTATVVMGSR